MSNNDEIPLEITGYETDMLEEKWGSYNEYLMSHEWKEVRWQILAREKNKCRDCGSEATEVHHIRYPKVLGDEDFDNLVALCRSCHKLRHTISSS